MPASNRILSSMALAKRTLFSSTTAVGADQLSPLTRSPALGAMEQFAKFGSQFQQPCRYNSSGAPWGGKDQSWVIVDLSVLPLGTEGPSISKYISEVERLLRNYPKVTTQLHANGTNIEGEWEDVMAAVKATHEKLHSIGIPRVWSNMRFGSRIDKKQTMQDKLDKVEGILKST